MADTKVMEAKVAAAEVARGLVDQYDFVAIIEWRTPQGLVQPVVWQMRLRSVHQGLCNDPFDGHVHSHRGDH